MLSTCQMYCFFCLFRFLIKNQDTPIVCGERSEGLFPFQSPGGAQFSGGQGAIGYNPNWNSGSGYQSWPNQAQSNDTSKYILLSFEELTNPKQATIFSIAFSFPQVVQAQLRAVYTLIHKLDSRITVPNGRSIIDPSACTERLT